MAAIGGTYDPDAKPSEGYGLRKPGEYVLEIVESSYDANSAGTGMNMKLKAQFVGGEYDRGNYYINLSLEHQDAETQARAQRDFAALRRSIGVLNPKDTEELHFKQFPVKIGVYKSKKTGEDNNSINFLFDKLADTPPANDNPRQPAAAAAKPAAAAAGKSRPWDKK